jgi:flagellar basal-body rod protein FlgF
MDTTLYVGLSDQMALQRRMDIIANNLANMNTTAFKRETVLFQSYVQKMEGTETPATADVSFVQDYGIVRDVVAGHLQTTGNTFDLAINDDGYFVTRTAQGETRYTRNGHFSLSSKYELVSSSGLPVLDAGGSPISFTPTDTGITFGADGVISTRERGVVGKVQVVKFANAQDMESVGDTMYKTKQTPTTVASPSIAQGMLESSNVQPIEEMINMITVSRQYQTIANLLDRQDQLQRSAISQLPTVQ